MNVTKSRTLSHPCRACPSRRKAGPGGRVRGGRPGALIARLSKTLCGGHTVHAKARTACISFRDQGSLAPLAGGERSRTPRLWPGPHLPCLWLSCDLETSCICPAPAGSDFSAANRYFLPCTSNQRHNHWPSQSPNARAPRANPRGLCCLHSRPPTRPLLPTPCLRPAWLRTPAGLRAQCVPGERGGDGVAVAMGRAPPWR